MRIRVATYNIHKGIGTDRRRSPERILDVLDEVRADIAAVQEIDRRFGARAAVLTPAALAMRGWRSVEINRRALSVGWHGNAILVRGDIGVLAHGHIDLPTLEPRGAVFADLRAAGRRLRVVGMHLDLSGLRRRQQARAIHHLLAGRAPCPTILMGDTNEWSASGGCLTEFAAHYRFAPTGPSFHSRRPLARLDRIMASAAVEFLDCGVHRSAVAAVASDHLPIWADVEF